MRGRRTNIQARRWVSWKGRVSLPRPLEFAPGDGWWAPNTTKPLSNVVPTIMSKVHQILRWSDGAKCSGCSSVASDCAINTEISRSKEWSTDSWKLTLNHKQFTTILTADHFSVSNKNKRHNIIRLRKVSKKTYPGFVLSFVTLS